MPIGSALQKAIAKAQKDYDLRIAPLSGHAMDVEVISTGNLAIDWITGVGGFPKGRIIELYGPPSSGKTTTATQCAAVCQQTGGVIAYWDYEQAIDHAYCGALGLDLDADTFQLAQPDTLEQGFGALEDLLDTGELDLIIVDSVASITTEAELKAEFGRRFQDKPLLMAQAMRKLTGKANKTKTIIIFINHIQDVVDTSPMGQQLAARGVKRTTTPGGKALKFHASMRLEFKPIGGLRESVDDALTASKVDVVTQQKVQIQVTKNKVASPFGQCETRVRFGKGFSQAFSVAQILVAHKAIRKEAGGVYRFDEVTQPSWMDVEKSPKDNWIRGEESFISKLEDDPEWLERLTLLARDALFVTPPEKSGATVEDDADSDIATPIEAATADELDSLLASS